MALAASAVNQTLPSAKARPCGPRKSAKIDLRFGFLTDQVDNGERME